MPVDRRKQGLGKGTGPTTTWANSIGAANVKGTLNGTSIRCRHGGV